MRKIVDDNLFIWADPRMLTVSEGLYEKLEAVGGKNKPSPFHTTGCGHLMGNFHPDALKVRMRRRTAAPATAS
ncbi:hypothetical protein [Mesorhizobium sp.]|uniref:hypothetical protein n=1 Tax=Mesorhizobium sp. TaxID=1871066 RepID=UPI000FE6FD06|nr:hypothetical protein [Mesorhizobium sp.]RWB28003.1 MAG: hypothetical protein EOQ43_24905 [Mesorhizobium sp.]RWE67288.1 MAG: hypothetical protein EOS62_15990 [Mesorhizobium sp.]RWI14485.1 MAG: hypothetical protein EOQ92_29100 [Mesorhizobium sp.]RWK29280.1 MAG: hypothetical protein EOR46_32900 [Mesorhizobium sp.]RWK90098.1 MAG: hypothetical protein EOR53_31145 [Mesorhizobium sp.]